MNYNILNEVNKNGIFINDRLLNDSDKKNLKKDFEKKKDYEFFQINDDDEIKKISETLFNFLHKDYVNQFLNDYLGNGKKCTHLLFTRTKPESKKKDSEYIESGSVLGFHNDDSGKQIKINILLSDLKKDSNGLEYAMASHKLSLLDRSIIKFLNIFGLFKNWSKHFINYQINKIRGFRVNFMSEEKVKSKFKLKRVFGKSGLIYIFDTNGFHRQATVENENISNSERELITIYFSQEKLN